MSINKLVSIKTPIVDALDQLGLPNNHDIALFTVWAIKAEKAINSYFQFERKRKVVDVCGCIAKLPEDAVYLQTAILGNLGEDCSDLLERYCNYQPESTTGAVSSSFLIIDSTTDFSQFTGSISHVVQDNKIILNHNYDGKKLTIQYLGYVCDDDGFLKVGENHVEAIMWFIIWRYYYRKKDKSYIERDMMREAQSEWNRECANARAKDGTLTESERLDLANMVSNPLLGRGVAVGIFNNVYNW